MWNKICRNIFILFFIISQGHSLKNGTLEEKIVRRKRLIISTPAENRIVTVSQVPYIVSILENSDQVCGGSILSERIIITAAHCVQEPGMYTVLSGTNNVEHAHLGKIHRVIKKLLHPEYRDHLNYNDIALLLINPPIDFQRSSNRNILLHSGDHLSPNTAGIFSGWGGSNKKGHFIGKRRDTLELRSLEMLIFDNGKCRRLYSRYSNITNKEICALDLHGRRRAELGDSGSPFVIQGKLAGILSFIGNMKIFPDVFINVAHYKYQHWINYHVRDNLANPQLYRPDQSSCMKTIHRFFCFRSHN